jgi:hypothetical protein
MSRVHKTRNFQLLCGSQLAEGESTSQYWSKVSCDLCIIIDRMQKAEMADRAKLLKRGLKEKSRIAKPKLPWQYSKKKKVSD